MEELELSEQCRLGNNQARKELYEQSSDCNPVLPQAYNLV